MPIEGSDLEKDQVQELWVENRCASTNADGHDPGPPRRCVDNTFLNPLATSEMDKTESLKMAPRRY